MSFIGPVILIGLLYYSAYVRDKKELSEEAPSLAWLVFACMMMIMLFLIALSYGILVFTGDGSLWSWLAFPCAGYMSYRWYKHVELVG